VQEAITFIEKKVEAGDTQGLIDACVDEYATIKSNPFADHILDELSLLDLRALYGDAVFPGQWPCLLKELLDIIKDLFGLDISRILKLKPTCPSSFKLGGHGDAYNHIHIDFVSRPDGWYLSNVWQCR